MSLSIKRKTELLFSKSQKVSHVYDKKDNSSYFTLRLKTIQLSRTRPKTGKQLETFYLSKTIILRERHCLSILPGTDRKTIFLTHCSDQRRTRTADDCPIF